MHSKTWRADIFLSEEDGLTRARAELVTGETGRRELAGSGVARRRPSDTEVPEIGDELAAARALSALAHELLDAAARDIEAFEKAPVRLSE